MKKNTALSYYLLTLALFLFLIALHMFSNGMFMDGLYYATISKNLADGMSSFWHPSFTPTLDPEFYSHPPLMFGLESIVFRFCGDSYLSERIYSFLTFVATGILVLKIWKDLSTNITVRTGWIPLLFWLSIPLSSWAIANNILENTMMVFTTATAFFFLKSRGKNRTVWMLFSGIALVLAFMSKGFTGLYLLSFPFWCFVFLKSYSWKNWLLDTFLLVFFFLCSLLLVYFVWPESGNYFHQYLQKQLFSSLTTFPEEDSRFFIVIRLLKELIPIFILLLIAFIFFRKTKAENKNYAWIKIFLCLGLSGVLPIMISLKQSGFYILTTFPFFAIGLALLIQPKIEQLIAKGRKPNRILVILSCILFLSSVFTLLTFSSRISRDQEKIAIVEEIKEKLPENSVVATKGNTEQDWALRAYCWRFGKIATASFAETSTYLLLESGASVDTSGRWEEIPVQSSKYILLKKQPF